MSENLATSALIGRLAMMKLYIANIYSNMSHAVCVYSYAMGRVLHGYSEIDASISSILQSTMRAALEAEYKQNIERMAVKALVLPVVFAEPHYSAETDPEAETMRLLANLNALEIHTFQTLEKFATEPAANGISVVSIPGLMSATKSRTRELHRIFNEIQSGTFWTRAEPANWLCLQCGFVSKSTAAFTECQCCGATREFASSN